MRGLRIARRYAKALMSIGKEDGQADAYKEQLGRFAGLLEEQNELAQILTNPLHDDEDRKRVLQAVTERLDFSEVMRAFLSLIFDKGRIQYVKDISAYYEKLTDELAGIVRAEVVSAAELSAGALEKIRKALSERTGKQVRLETRVNSALIGGAVAKIGDLVLDGSVRTQLMSLKESLQRGEGF